MKRRSLLLLGALAPIALFSSRYLAAEAAKVPILSGYGERAQQLNELAANIRTPADARRLVDFIAELFSKETPHGWSSNSLRSRIAQAEFSAVSDSQKFVPEPRLAQAWNAYVETIGGPEDQKATTEEIHYLRDGLLTSARMFWQQGSTNFWAVPSIYATQPDGNLAPGCRAVESIRLLWDLANMPDNLKGARDRVSKGKLFSDLVSKPQQAIRTTYTESRMIVGFAATRPLEIAKRRYIALNGNRAYSHVVVAMLDTTLA